MIMYARKYYGAFLILTSGIACYDINRLMECINIKTRTRGENLSDLKHMRVTLGIVDTVQP